jgi:hypothetical protein
MKIEIKRTYNTKITTGVLSIGSEFMTNTMELPWLNNGRNISCIPEGMYEVIKQKATKTRPYDFFRLMFVPDRSGILIHRITYVKDLRGCIGVGREWFDLNKDGIPELIKSGDALREMINRLPDSFTLEIKS